MDTHLDITINGKTRRIIPTKEREINYLKRTLVDIFQLTTPQSY